MKLFKKIRNKEETETIGLNPTIEELAQFFRMDISITGEKLTSATYYACMLIRCNAIAKLPLKLMKHTDGQGNVKATGHNLYHLMKYRPNRFTNSHDFLWATEFQRLEHGNAFWVMDVRNGKIQNVYLLDSRGVTIIVDDTGILDEPNSVFYMYSDPKKGTLYYSSDEIVHFKHFSLDGIKGTPIKKYIGQTIENEQYSQKILSEKYKSGLQDPIIVQYVGDLDKERQAKIQKKFANLGGAKNAGKVVPVPTEFKVSQLETKLVNSQFFQLQGLTTRHIANAFGVKSFQLNDMEKSTYNNIEQQNKAFYSDTLQNVLTTYEQEMTYKMLTRQEQIEGYYLQFNVDSILRSDLQTRTSAYSEAIKQGWKSRAEVREMEGLPYIEGTNELTVDNGACIPLKDLGNQYKKGDESNNE
ncbi:MAG: phage portal protein [Hominilimicola sp.]